MPARPRCTIALRCMEGAGSRTGLSRNAGRRELGADLSMGERHNEHRPKDLNTHDGAGSGNDSGSPVRLTRMRGCGRLRQSSGALALRVEQGCAAQKLDSFGADFVGRVTLARISHQVLCNAKQMSSGEAAMRARKAKPRPSGWMEPGNRVSPSQGGFGDALTLVFPCPGAVLPQPGFPCHLPGGEKSV